MMQMLSSGGLEPVTDQIRVPDTDNPRGYFELEKVKKLKEDASWLVEARGKVIKMISALLYDLPSTEKYRVLFMRRDIDEILASQEKMLERLGKPAAPRDQMRAAYQLHLDRLFGWLHTQQNFATREFNYNRLMVNPVEVIAEIHEFLGRPIDSEKMLEAVAPDLYRNRSHGRNSHSPKIQ